MEEFKLKLFILKVKGRCNINCSYCYEYNLADQSWKDKPATMSLTIVEQAAKRIGQHVLKHGLEIITIVFHGGEPLLLPPEWFVQACQIFSDHLPSGVKILYGLQSNGMLLDEAYLEVLCRLNIKVGISLDGTRESNDKFRVDFKGRSTFERTLNGITLLSQPKYESINSGILTVIDPFSDPIRTFDFLSSLRPKHIDFLYPHYHHDGPPPFPVGAISTWLCTVFDQWWDTDSDIRIRLFEDMLHLMLGGTYSVEHLGLAPIELLVIQTDGAYEAVDSLKSTFEGAVFTGKNVMKDEFDTVLENELIKSRIDRAASLCASCKACEWNQVCGGGYIPHRYSEANGFDNPSIYCADLKLFFSHIRTKLENFAPEIRQLVPAS